jgi:hypothetical protein
MTSSCVCQNEPEIVAFNNIPPVHDDDNPEYYSLGDDPEYYCFQTKDQDGQTSQLIINTGCKNGCCRLFYSKICMGEFCLKCPDKSPMIGAHILKIYCDSYSNDIETAVDCPNHPFNDVPVCDRCLDVFNNTESDEDKCFSHDCKDQVDVVIITCRGPIKYQLVNEHNNHYAQQVKVTLNKIVLFEQ